LYAVADQNDMLAEQARGRLGFEKAYGDWRKLIEDPAVDVIDITTPNNLHAETALAAIEAGKHVFCEKPMAVKIEMPGMAAAARRTRTMVVFNNLKTQRRWLLGRSLSGEIGGADPFPWGSTRVLGTFLPWSWRCCGTGVLEH
jgi:predicted dehydrogenase